MRASGYGTRRPCDAVIAAAHTIDCAHAAFVTMWVALTLSLAATKWTDFSSDFIGVEREFPLPTILSFVDSGSHEQRG